MPLGEAVRTNGFGPASRSSRSLAAWAAAGEGKLPRRRRFRVGEGEEVSTAFGHEPEAGETERPRGARAAAPPGVLAGGFVVGRDLADRAERAGVPADTAAFDAALEARLSATAAATGQGFPRDEHVEIVGGESVETRPWAGAAGHGQGRYAPRARFRTRPGFSIYDM